MLNAGVGNELYIARKGISSPEPCIYGKVLICAVDSESVHRLGIDPKEIFSFCDLCFSQ